MEIEAKYAVTAPLDPAQVETLDLRPYALRDRRAARQHDLLLDTATRALTARQLTLRLRAVGDQVTITTKGPNAGGAGIHEREEIEVTLAAPAPSDYRRWPPEIVRRIEPIVGDLPLQTLVEVDVLRFTWDVAAPSGVIAELALDEGMIAANARTTPVHELEVELKGDGTREDLNALQGRLTMSLPLQPEMRSKFEQGLALYA
jgi:inorganic triphosphatase YgiF